MYNKCFTVNDLNKLMYEAEIVNGFKWDTIIYKNKQYNIEDLLIVSKQYNLAIIDEIVKYCSYKELFS